MKKAAWIMMAMMVAATTWAQPGGGGGKPNKKDGDHGGRGMNPERMAKELGLTEQQQDALGALQHEWQTKLVDLRADSQKAKLELRRIMREPESTRDEIIKAVEVDNAADLAMAKARVDHFLKVRELLGPEKAAQMHEMRGAFRDDERGQGEPIPRGGKNRGPDNPAD